MRVVFYALMQMFPDKQYFSLRTDVYRFVVDHWQKICVSKKRMFAKQILYIPFLSPLSSPSLVVSLSLLHLRTRAFDKLQLIILTQVISFYTILGSENWKKQV